MAEEVRIITDDGTLHKAFVDITDDGVENLFVLNSDSARVADLGSHVVRPTSTGVFSFKPEDNARNPCLRCFGRCGAIFGDDGRQCTLASGHELAHKFEEDGGDADAS